MTQLEVVCQAPLYGSTIPGLSVNGAGLFVLLTVLLYKVVPIIGDFFSE